MKQRKSEIIQKQNYRISDMPDILLQMNSSDFRSTIQFIS